MNIPMHEELLIFNTLSSEIQGLYHDACVMLGLSDSAFNILYSLVEFGEGCTPRDIYRSFGTSRQTIHSSIANLAREEVIELRKGSGRERNIYLTEKGSRLVKERIIPLMALENDILGGWSEDERKELVRLTRKYRDDFKNGLSSLKTFGYSS